jgi:hypothetical protein
MGEKEKAKADLEAILRLNPDKTMRSGCKKLIKTAK